MEHLDEAEPFVADAERPHAVQAVVKIVEGLVGRKDETRCTPAPKIGTLGLEYSTNRASIWGVHGGIKARWSAQHRRIRLSGSWREL